MTKAFPTEKDFFFSADERLQFTVSAINTNKWFTVSRETIMHALDIAALFEEIYEIAYWAPSLIDNTIMVSLVNAKGIDAPCIELVTLLEANEVTA